MLNLDSNSHWSPEIHRDDFSPRCYQTCDSFKLLRWCSKTDFIGVCTLGHIPTPNCSFWNSSFYVDPNLKDGNELLLFSK